MQQAVFDTERHVAFSPQILRAAFIITPGFIIALGSLVPHR